MNVTYDEKDKSVTFNLLIYDLNSFVFDSHSYMFKFDLLYSEDARRKYYYIIRAKKESIDEVKDMVWMDRYVNTFEKLEFPNSYNHEKSQFLVGEKLEESQHKEGEYTTTSKSAYMSIKWYLPKSFKRIYSVKLEGCWIIRGYSQKQYKIDQVYTLNIVNSNSKVMKEAPIVLNSKISDNVKVNKNTDAIFVKGTEDGEEARFIILQGKKLNHSLQMMMLSVSNYPRII